MDSNADARAITVRGRLTGCSFGKEWWIRYVAMFDVDGATLTRDGFIDRGGGVTMTAPDRGVRTILIVGRGRLPVKAIAVDLMSGLVSDFGVVDVSEGCKLRLN
jgi:hypothetical protein